MWDVIGHLPTWLQAFVLIGCLIIILIPILGITYWIVRKMDRVKILGKLEAEDDTPEDKK